MVLGAGGVSGGAWHAGALAALASATGWDSRDAAVIVGTSAGSITGGALRAGLSPEDLWRISVDEALSPAGARLYGRVTAQLGELSRLRPPRPLPANPTLLRAMVRLDPRPGVALAGLLPEGATSTDPISTRLDELLGPDWPPDPLWVVAVDLSSGRRVIFGQEALSSNGAGYSVGQAVAASCAVPSFFTPVEIDGRRYVDGGVHSTTNADLLRNAGLDLVLVSAPMAGWWRSLRPHPALVTRIASRIALDREVAAIRRSGTPVLVLQPGHDDTPLMDGRAMDPDAIEPMARQARRSVAAALDRPEVAELLSVLG